MQDEANNTCMAIQSVFFLEEDNHSLIFLIEVDVRPFFHTPIIYHVGVYRQELQPTCASPLGLKPRGLRRAEALLLSDMQVYVLTIALSMGVTILLAAAVSVLGRSLAFGLSVALIWFPADNIGSIVLLYAYRLTHYDFWQNISAYLLGPNLNAMPTVLTPRNLFSIGITPLVNVDGTHTLLVALVYSLIFAAVAFVLMWRRDVKE